MRVRRELALLATGLAVSLAAISGCQETAKQAIHVRQPAATPRPQVSANVIKTSSLEGLPLPNDRSELATLVGFPEPLVDALLDKVEARFNAGQQAYQAGQPDVARVDFNAALHELVSSRLQATGDVRLRQLFNRIVDTMQNDEMQVEAKDEATAEENEEAADNEENAANSENTDNSSNAANTQASGETAAQNPPAPTAPIEEVAELENLPATDPRMAALAEKELITVPHDLPLTVNPSVLQYLSFFASPRGRDIVEMGLQRAGRYRAMIEARLKKEGLPLDLVYLAQAESAFKPRALSRTGAQGIWQFMPYTGEMYGLHRSYWVDQRDDPVAATESAAEMLKDLYASFGDWYLAMAAYNSGPMNVTRAVQHTGYADFWKLQQMNALPEQTKNYVPIIVALALVAKDPGLYGIQVNPDPAPPVDTVQMEHPISLQLVADATGATLEDLQAMNPELVHGIAPAGFAFSVPKGTVEQLKTEIAGIPADKLTAWRVATFTAGDTLPEVARRYHVTLVSLENVNMIDPHDPPDAGKLLMIPAPPRLILARYRVRRGDTLGSIAARHRVTVSELREWNHLRGNEIFLGHWLRIYEHGYVAETDAIEHSVASERRVSRRKSSARIETASHEVVKHRVRSGETLWSIAQMYGTTVAALKEANPFLASRELEVGDRLNIARQ